VEPTGAETQITSRLGSDRLVATVRERLDCREGDKLSIKPDLAKVHLFDAETGKRLAASSLR
jgi:multiple sugar transport system ATP-binding protein